VNSGSRKAPRKNTVLIADDHAILTEGLARLLRDNDFDVVGTVSNGQLLLEEAGRLHPDVIVTDLTMPGLSGLDVLERLKSRGIASKVILLTMHNDADLATIAMRRGASGFLLKESAGEELLEAIRQALRGRVYLTPALTQGVMELMAGAAGATAPQLTPRQIDVLRLIVKGQRMKEIAENLGLSVRTVETHKYEMMEALGLHSTAELVRYALDRRLVLD
jgi:DNA-binding NarL/FixJ family response regulator